MLGFLRRVSASLTFRAQPTIDEGKPVTVSERTMGHITPKVLSHYDVPRRTMALVHFLLDMCSDILLNAILSHGSLCEAYDFLLQILCHINVFDHGLVRVIAVLHGRRVRSDGNVGHEWKAPATDSGYVNGEVKLELCLRSKHEYTTRGDSAVTNVV